MNRTLNTHLEHIDRLISDLKEDNINLEKLTELQKSLELLSQKIKTSKLDNFSDSRETNEQGIRKDASFIFDKNFRILRFVGSAENILGKWKINPSPMVHEIFEPEDFKRFKDKTNQLLSSSEQQAFNIRILNNQFSLPVIIWLEKVKLNGTNAVMAELLFQNQKSDFLKEYQEILIENLPNIDVFLFDIQFKHVLAGGSEKERFNLINSDFTGRTLYEIYEEKIQKRLFPFYKNAIDGQMSEGEVRIMGHDYFISATPVRNINDEVVGGALIMQNKTREKEVERSLIKAKKEAEDADKAKSLFLAIMSHEIRTPLNAIIGFAGFLNKTDLTPEQKKFSGIINQSSEHLLSVVNEILFLFKLGIGKVFIEKIPFNLFELVADVHESLLLRAAEKELSFEYQIDKNVPEILTGDPFRIKQILINLLGNAIKFTDSGKVELLVSGEKTGKKKVVLRFEVEDTGVGISKDDLEKIFDEFVQSEVKNEKTRKGVGLGLTITKKLVDLLDGWLHVSSEPGKGSKFTVVIAFERPQKDEIVLQEKEYEIKYNLLEGKKILYADDDENNILLGESILKEWKSVFALAHDGAEALEMLLAEKFDAVLLDIHMPGFSGVEVIKKIRKKKNPNQHTKMLAVTANIMENDLKEYLESGFDDYILKPFREEKLYSKICGLLEIVQNEDQLFSGSKAETGLLLSKDGFDTSLLLKTANGDPDFFNTMIDTFIENINNSLKSFLVNLKEENWKEIGEKAHKIIPSCSFFGLSGFVNDLAELENLTLRVKKYKQVPMQVEKLSKEMKKLIREARKAKIGETGNKVR